MAELTRSPFGPTGLRIPPIVFGTSCLGNLYRALDEEVKLAIMRAWFEHVPPPVVADSAGKYGAGLALEVIGRGLQQLSVPPEQVIISNKLGWYRVPLRGPEPTFEPGVWVGLEHDAEQRLGYDGILDCWEQGCELLGAYRPRLVSVHDPDEYLAAADSAADLARRRRDVLEAYRALSELRDAGEVVGVGVGAKDWTVIRWIDAHVRLDWVMPACSLTIYRHPPDLVEFIQDLTARGLGIINSAVFNAGFLVGGRYFDYRAVSPDSPDDAPLFAWRERFFRLCAKWNVEPAVACVQFGLSPPGVAAVALNTSKPERVADNVRAVQADIPAGFWRAMKREGLIRPDYPWV